MNTTASAATGPQDNNKHTGMKRIIIAIAGVLVLLAGLWIWKAIQIGTIKKEARQEREQIRSKAAQTIVEVHRQHLLALAKPYVWAIRSEMLRNADNQVDLFANEMIKEENFRRIVVADQQGKIISSTDKKFVGAEFTTVGKPVWLTSDSTIIENSNDSTLTISSPVMGFNSRLGTLLISYSVNLPGYLKDTAAK